MCNVLMYVVIVCPRCHKAHGVRLSTKRTRCTGCGFSIDVGKAKVYHRTDSKKDLVEAVGQVSKSLGLRLEGEMVVSRFDADGPPKEAKGRPCFNEERVRSTVVQLTEELGEFSSRDLAERLDIRDRESLEKLIGDMLREGIVFEPRGDRYRAV